jgi:ankyrin repeat protein
LQAASHGGNTKIFRLLLENGANVNAPGGRFGSALQVASIHGRVEFVQYLLQHGADVNAAGGRYGSALQAASLEGNMEIFRLLLQYGADVNPRAENMAAHCKLHPQMVVWQSFVSFLRWAQMKADPPNALTGYTEVIRGKLNKSLASFLSTARTRRT